MLRWQSGLRRLLNLLALMGLAGCSEARRGEQPSGEPWDSPRIAALDRDLKAGDHAATERFWREMSEKAPLIEPVDGDSKHVRLTFLWRGGDGTRSVAVSGGLPTGEFTKPLKNLSGTDVWCRTERLPSDARFLYAFSVQAGGAESSDDAGAVHSKSLKTDPLNRLSLTGMSVAELPDAPPLHWQERQPNLPEGGLKLEFIDSSILKENRPVTVYTPPGYDRGGGPYGLLVILDGEVYGSSGQDTLIPTPTILDNLIAAKRIPPVVAVLVNNIRKRNRDLACSAPFADFLAKELVPWVRDRERIDTDPSKVVIIGSSFGGLCAAYCGLRHPDVFGVVLSQSGSFIYYPDYPGRPPTFETETGWLTRQFVAKPKVPLRVYLSVGRFERWFPQDNVAENRRMRDVLEAKGYSVIYSEYDGGHDYLCWRKSLADGLIALLGRP